MSRGVTAAGSVFLGHYSCESAGDYASGTNHTLPTSGHAKAYSGVSLDSFVKKITFQQLSEEGVASIGNAVEIMADAEQLMAHKNAMTLRLGAVKAKELGSGFAQGDYLSVSQTGTQETQVPQTGQQQDDEYGSI